MVNKREKTRSLVYQMKEDIFHQEAALAELECGESSGEKVPETTVIPLPKFCHHSTGTVYDEPTGILRTARLFEERGQVLDRKNSSLDRKNSLLLSQKTPTPLHSKTRRALDVSPTRSRRNRQNARPSQADVDGLTSTPAASRSPIQQLFRDKMEGLESGGWAASSFEVKTDSSTCNPGDVHNETSELLAISTEDLYTTAVPGTVSSAVSPSSNGFVKILSAVDDKKPDSNSQRVDHEGRETKPVSIEHMPLSDATLRSENAFVPAVTTAIESHEKPVVDDISKTDEASNVLQVKTDQVITSRENDRLDTETANSENVEKVKVRARSASRSTNKKCLNTAKKDSLKESHVSEKDTDSLDTRKKDRVSKKDTSSVDSAKKDLPKDSCVSKKDTNTKQQIPTRRRISKEQDNTEKMNHVTEELKSNLEKKSSVPRSAKKTSSSDQVTDGNASLTDPPAATEKVNCVLEEFGPSPPKKSSVLRSARRTNSISQVCDSGDVSIDQPAAAEKINLVSKLDSCPSKKSGVSSRKSSSIGQVCDGNTVPTHQPAAAAKVNHMSEELNTSPSKKSRVPRSARKTNSIGQVCDSNAVPAYQPTAAEKVSEELDSSPPISSKKSSMPRSAKKTSSIDQVCDGQDGLTDQPAAAEKVNRVLEESSPSKKSGVPRSARKTSSMDQVRDDSDVLTDLSAAAENVNRVSEELDLSPSKKSSVSRSAKKTANTEQVCSGSNSPTKQPSSKSENLKRAGSSSRSCPRKNNKICTEVESGSKSDGGLKQESPEDEQHKAAAGKKHKVPSQDSSVSNLSSVSDSTPQQMGNSNLEASFGTSLTKPATLDSETSNRPYFHSDNFRLVEVNSSESSEHQSQSTACLQTVKYDAIDLNSSTTVDSTHSGDGAMVNSTPVVDSNSTSELKPVFSPQHQESGISSDVCDMFPQETPVSESEHVKKPTSSASRSSLKTQPGERDVDATKEHYGDTEKNSAGKDRTKKAVGRPRKRISSVSVDTVAVTENAESHVVKQTGDDASSYINAVLAVYNKAEETPSHISTDNSMTELPVSASSECSLASATTDSHVDLNSILPTDTSWIASEGRSDASDVDNLLTGLKSTAADHDKSPRNIVPKVSKSESSMDNLSSPKTGMHGISTGTALPVNHGWTSGLNNVGSQLSELAKTSASGRKRAAHLMAGCRPRTVGVKRPPPTIDETVSDQHMDKDANAKYDRPHTSEHIRSDLDSDKSADNGYSYPNTPRHVPFSQMDISRSADTLAESSDRFFPVTPPVDITAKFISSPNYSGSDKVSEELIRNKPAPLNPPEVIEDSLLKQDQSRLYEQPQLTRYNPVDSGFSGSLLGSPESKTLSPPPPVVHCKGDSRRESLRAELLRKFLPSQLLVSDSIKRRVQDGLQLLSSIRSAPTICSHTRQKLADYLNQSHKEVRHERLPLRPIDDKCDQSTTSVRRQLPVRPRRRIYPDWEYVSGDEFTSPVSDVESNSDSDYVVDIEDLTETSRSLVRNRERRMSTVHH